MRPSQELEDGIELLYKQAKERSHASHIASCNSRYYTDIHQPQTKPMVSQVDKSKYQATGEPRRVIESSYIYDEEVIQVELSQDQTGFTCGQF